MCRFDFKNKYSMTHDVKVHRSEKINLFALRLKASLLCPNDTEPPQILYQSIFFDPISLLSWFLVERICAAATRSVTRYSSDCDVIFGQLC